MRGTRTVASGTHLSHHDEDLPNPRPRTIPTGTQRRPGGSNETDAWRCIQNYKLGEGNNMRAEIRYTPTMTDNMTDIMTARM